MGIPLSFDLYLYATFGPHGVHFLVVTFIYEKYYLSFEVVDLERVA